MNQLVQSCLHPHQAQVQRRSCQVLRRPCPDLPWRNISDTNKRCKLRLWRLEYQDALRFGRAVSPEIQRAEFTHYRKRFLPVCTFTHIKVLNCRWSITEIVSVKALPQFTEGTKINNPAKLKDIFWRYCPSLRLSWSKFYNQLCVFGLCTWAWCSISSIQGTNVPQIYNQMPTSSSPRHAPPSLAWLKFRTKLRSRPFDGILLAIWPGTDWCEESTCHSSHAKSFLFTSSIVWLPSYPLSK